MPSCWPGWDALGMTAVPRAVLLGTPRVTPVGGWEWAPKGGVPAWHGIGLTRWFPPTGTLHPNCQDSSGRPRRDIGTILQILNDLLSATRHYQGMPQSLTQLRCQTQCSPSAPSSPELAAKATSETLTTATSVASQPLHSVVQCQSQIRMCKPSGKPHLRAPCPKASRAAFPHPVA